MIETIRKYSGHALGVLGATTFGLLLLNNSETSNCLSYRPSTDMHVLVCDRDENGIADFTKVTSNMDAFPNEFPKFERRAPTLEEITMYNRES